MLLEYITVVYATLIALSIVTPVIASCIMLISLAKDVKYFVKINRKCAKSKTKRLRMKKLLSELIEFHSNGIGLSKNLSYIFFTKNQ